MRTGRRMFGVAVLALALSPVAACGSSANDGIATVNGAQAGANPTPSATGDRTQQLLQFAQCMRDHGVDVPDPGTGGGFRLGGGGATPSPGASGSPGGSGGGRVFNRDDPAFQAAFQACRDKLPNGGQPPKLSAEQLAQYVKWAQCMRDHNVNIPDPNPDGTLQFGRGRGSGQFDPQDPTFQAALQACQSLRPNLRPSGSTR
jgi:hypothetical protein